MLAVVSAVFVAAPRIGLRFGDPFRGAWARRLWPIGAILVADGRPPRVPRRPAHSSASSARARPRPHENTLLNPKVVMETCHRSPGPSRPPSAYKLRVPLLRRREIAPASVGRQARRAREKKRSRRRFYLGAGMTAIAVGLLLAPAQACARPRFTSKRRFRENGDGGRARGPPRRSVAVAGSGSRRSLPPWRCRRPSVAGPGADPLAALPWESRRGGRRGCPNRPSGPTPMLSRAARSRASPICPGRAGAGPCEVLPQLRHPPDVGGPSCDARTSFTPARIRPNRPRDANKRGSQPCGDPRACCGARARFNVPWFLHLASRALGRPLGLLLCPDGELAGFASASPSIRRKGTKVSE